MVLSGFENGQVSGTIEYPSLRCRGALQYIGGTLDTVFLKEKIDNGSGGACVDGGSIEIKKVASDGISWRWLYPNGALGGTAQFSQTR
jgi:hypothetical protein